MLKKRTALLATIVSAGALAAAVVAASPVGAAGVTAAGPSCTARDGGSCTLRPGSIGGAITFVAHDQAGSTWTIQDVTTGHTAVFQTGNSSASGTLTNTNTSGWAAGDDIVLSISGKGSIKATWKAAVRHA